MGRLGGIPLDVGDVLAKKYRLERLVGEGGTGVVVAATHLQLERPVAIKFLRTALASDEVRLRFERESRAIGQMTSDHVVALLDVGTLPDASPYMVMEYLEGRDLARVLKEDGPLRVEEAIDCILQVCEALKEAHALGVIHRDLKPANLLLTRRADGAPHVKVVDFGVSKILDPKLLGAGRHDVTRNYDVLGSPRYMAPEQLRSSRDVDGRADVWSLGAVLFQLVSGKSAFAGETPVQVGVAVLAEAPAKLCALASHAPEELEGIVDRCLRKEPNERYASVAELAEALRPLASARARESLDLLAAAREAPGVQVALDAASIAPGSAYIRVTRPPTTASEASASQRADRTRSEPPTFASDAAERRSGRRVGVMVTIGAGLVLLFAFVALTAAKSAARSFGVLSEPSASASIDPATSADAAPRLERTTRPSPAITVTLDAGGPPP